jgi:2-beta-glucuronyltransferase
VLFLAKRLKTMSPDARMVYRISDDLRLLDSHPALIDLEKNLLPLFDLISVPSRYIYDRYSEHPNLELHTHGIRKELFDKNYPNPYTKYEGPNLVFVGQAHLDHDFLEIAGGLFPNWQFHIIGPLRKIVKRDNIYYYDEMPFQETVPYLKYADIGLHTLSRIHGVESFTDSLKVIQYEYCRLPIVAPNYITCNRPQVQYYIPGDPNSINNALSQAINFDRNKISVDHINSWDDLTSKLTGEKTKLMSI